MTGMSVELIGYAVTSVFIFFDYWYYIVLGNWMCILRFLEFLGKVLGNNGKMLP